MTLIKNSKIKNLILGIFFIFSPFFVLADFRINEVMYDLSGTDTDREWVEIQNTGGSEILKDLRFVDKNGRHLIKSSSGETEFPANSCIILAKDITAFKNDNPSFSGVVFESSLSLVNTTDQISFIKFVDSSESVFDKISYSSEIGAKGDGNSLHRENDLFKALSPNPGICSLPSNPVVPEVSNNPQQGENNQETGATKVVSNQNVSLVEPQIFLRINGYSVGNVGSPLIFKAELTGIDKKPINNARIIWSFGDGTSLEGYTVSHSWNFPGNYFVVAEASSDIYNASSKLKVAIGKADVGIAQFISGESGFIELVNHSNLDVDISNWILESQNIKFFLPKNTFLPASSKISIANSVTKIFDFADIFLNYPNGSRYFTFHPSQKKTLEESIVKDAVVIETKHQESKDAIEEKVLNSGPKDLNMEDEYVKLSANSSFSKSNNYLIWSVFVISTFCVMIVLFYISSSNKNVSDGSSEADEYTIEEINDKP